jgi:hypothetical protein
MPQRLRFSVSRRLSFRAWLTILLATALVVAVGIAMAVLAIGIFVILVPAMIVASAVYYVLQRAGFRPVRSQEPREPRIVDGEFRIIDTHEIERETPRQGPLQDN